MRLWPGPVLSIRRRLAVLILGALVTFLLIDTTLIYRSTLDSINVAHDRTLLVSARAIGETLRFSGDRLDVGLPSATLDVFEAVMRGRIVYRVSDPDGRFLAGTAELPSHDGAFPKRSPYAALASFQDAQFDGEAVRVVALLHPVYDGAGYRMVTVQVAENVELRRSLAKQGLIATLDRQIIFLMLLSVLIWWLIGRGLRPLAALGDELRKRPPDSLAALTTPAPRELRPIVEALNEVMGRLKGFLENRQRFVRDASHQLRTPLAVLKAQVQNAQRGDVAASVALHDIAQSVDRATRLANQMLALAKVAQMESEGDHAGERTELVALARDLAVECSPLLAAKSLDFALDAPPDEPVLVAAHEWMLRELLRNLLSNAIRHTPPSGAIGIDIALAGRTVLLAVWDSGPGVDAEREARLFEPFASGDPNRGSGLGLVICRDICRAVGARLTVRNRKPVEGAQRPGLRVTVEMSRVETSAVTAVREPQGTTAQRPASEADPQRPLAAGARTEAT